MKKIFSVKILIGVFNAICLAVAIALIVYWTYQFSLNKDVSSIDYKRYHDSELDKYPLLSICFNDFLSKTKIQEQNNRTKVSEYVSFLKGKNNSAILTSRPYEGFQCPNFLTIYDESVKTTLKEVSFSSSEFKTTR